MSSTDRSQSMLILLKTSRWTQTFSHPLTEAIWLNFEDFSSRLLPVRICVIYLFRDATVLRPTKHKSVEGNTHARPLQPLPTGYLSPPSLCHFHPPHFTLTSRYRGQLCDKISGPCGDG
jgi:hypothetical protein